MIVESRVPSDEQRQRFEVLVQFIMEPLIVEARLADGSTTGRPLALALEAGATRLTGERAHGAATGGGQAVATRIRGHA